VRQHTVNVFQILMSVKREHTHVTHQHAAVILKGVSSVPALQTRDQIVNSVSNRHCIKPNHVGGVMSFHPSALFPKLLNGFQRNCLLSYTLKYVGQLSSSVFS
jgi:hypothetical protein